jgi:hypothetical protein
MELNSKGAPMNLNYSLIEDLFSKLATLGKANFTIDGPETDPTSLKSFQSLQSKEPLVSCFVNFN